MALATVDDLLSYGFTVATTDEALTERLLDSVSAAIEDAAGIAIGARTSTVTLPGTAEQFLRLPAAPVRSLVSVEVDGSAVADVKVRDRRLWRAAGWGGQHVDVTVTYEHGLDPIPADIVRLTCQFAGAGLLAAQSGELVRDRTVAYERIDDYQAGYRQGDDEVYDVTVLPERVKASLRTRFSGSAMVTGTY